MPSWGVHLGIANKVLKNIDNIDKICLCLEM